VPPPITLEQAERGARRRRDRMRGVARVDTCVRTDVELLVNELNTIPRLTETSVYAKAFEALGLGYGGRSSAVK
jgi:D-alanine-D-alanine ligase-like ATP-grasp enzyme